MFLFPFLELYPKYLALVLLLTIISITICYKDILKNFKKISKKTWIILLIIFTVGLIIRLFFIPHTHYVYNDEFNHVNVAQNILYRNEFCHCSLGNNTHCLNCTLGETWPPGHPFLGSISMGIFGDSEKTLFNLTAILGSFSIILFFLLSYLIYKSEKISLIGAFIFSFIPIHIKYSGSFALSIPAVFWILLSMITLEIFIKEKKISIFYTFLFLTLYAILTRTEVIILPGIYFIYILTKINYKIFLKKKYILAILIFLTFLIVPIQQIYYDTYISQAPGWNEKTSTKLEHAKNNIGPLIGFYFNSYFHPIILTILFFSGFYFLIKQKDKKIIYLSLFYLSFFFVYLTYHISNYSIFKDTVRYFLLTYLPFILISLKSFEFYLKEKKYFFTLFILFIFLISLTPSTEFLKDSSTGNGDNYLDYKIYYNFEKIIPNNVFVITTHPTKIIATIKKNVITPTEFLDWIEKNKLPLKIYLYNSHDFDNFDYFYYLEEFYVFKKIFYEEELDPECEEFCLFTLYELTLKEKQSFLN